MNIEKTQIILPDEATQIKIRQFAEFLLAENEKYNLVGNYDLDLLWKEQILDSLILSDKLKSNLLDIGSGGGLPAIPLALTNPDVQFNLVDSNNKKIEFLSKVIKEFKLNNVQLFKSRAEDFAKNNKTAFDGGSAKALAKVNVLLEYFSPLIRTNGICYFYKGPDYANEIQQAEKAAVITGFEIEKIWNYEINEKQRYILSYRKKYPGKINLPRPVGMASKTPL